MTTWKLIIVFIMYASTTYDYYQSSQYGFSLMFGCYALSIIAIILAARGI